MEGTSTDAAPPIRAEPVGSLLRPPALRSLYERIYEGHDSHVARLLTDDSADLLTELETVADAAIADAVRHQIDCGLDVVTDGEMRRAHYVNSLFEGLDGIGEDTHREYFAGEDDVAPPPEPIATSRLRVVDNPLVREFTFVRSLTSFPSKVTIQTPSSFYFPASRYAEGVYPSPDAFVQDMVGAVRQLVREAVDAGVRYVQLDYPLYPALADPTKRGELLASTGDEFEAILEKAIAADNAVFDSIPEGVTTAIHICRGNFRSRWWAEGSLEPVAEAMFNEVRCDRFLVEWEDTAREGDYSPLRFVPPGRTVVMGLISSKVDVLESEDDVVGRLAAAAQAGIDMDQLAISPQCGFASVWHGNEITADTQWRKLELVSSVARRVWG
jgi:5-methyltetrahydropteroyltriglutamate--homocysteine methyltransferase